MMGKHSNAAALSLLLLLLSGCDDPTTKLDLGYEELPPLLQLDREVPIIYDSQMEALPLHTKQYQAVVDYALQRAPEGQRIWFLLVAINSRLEGREYGGDFRAGTVYVYFTPDTRTPRLRKGQGMFLSVSGTEIQNLTEWLTKQPTGSYYQVSTAGEPFTGTLNLPSKLLWPFSASGQFSDGEITEAVDLARYLMGMTDGVAGMANGLITHGRGTHLGQRPIHSIRRNPDGSVTVCTGTQQDVLCGRGEFFRYVKRDGKWVILAFGTWMA